MHFIIIKMNASHRLELFGHGKDLKALRRLLLLLGCYRFRKLPKAFLNLNTQRTVTKLRIHIRDLTPDRSTV